MVPTGERSFHVLYYLLAGTSQAEKHHLGLDTGQKRWRYLGHPTQLKVGINDSEGFTHFRTALRKLEFPKQEIAEICQILATVLHIGQLEFHSSRSTTPAADESGGYGADGGENVTTVKNKETLSIIAAFMGVSMEDLEVSLGYKTKVLHRERVTLMLDPQGARDNADELARTLYSLLVAYVIESINQRMCAAEDAIGNTISIVDFPGLAISPTTGSTLDQLLNNAAAESLYNFALQSFFERKADLLESEDIQVPPTSYFDNSDTIKGLLKPGNGLLSILDDQMRRGRTDMQFLESCRRRFENKNPAISVGSSTTRIPGSNFATHNARASFMVRHFAGEVEYVVDGLMDENSEVVSGDMLNLVESTKSEFVRALFKQEALQTTYHPRERTTIVQGTLSSKPTRKPSLASRNRDRSTGRVAALARKFGMDEPINEAEPLAKKDSSLRRGNLDNKPIQGASAEFLTALENIASSLSSPNTNPYFVFCLKSNDRRIANQFDSRCVRHQLQALGIVEISQRVRSADFSVFMPFSEFLGLAETDDIFAGSDHDKAAKLLQQRRWPVNEARVGSTGVLLSERCWSAIARVTDPGSSPRETAGNDFHLDDGTDGKAAMNESRMRLLDAPSPGYLDEKHGAYFASKELDTQSDAGVSAFNGGDMFRNMETRVEMADKGNDKTLVEVDDVIVSAGRKRWLFLVYMLTFYVPDFLIRSVGRISRKDVRMAWREKLAINMLIWASCGFVVFFIGELNCPLH